ncbi:MAG: ATP-dependent DNA helicase [Candidatus Thermoplasmatota archaeon]
MQINKEKQNIINCDGNILVTANPGTGKTLLLAHKYVDLLDEGIGPDEILCLTYTRKARKEMQDRITEIIKEKDLDVDLSELNIHTFHSYAHEHIEEDSLISPDLLRYSIFRYLKEDEVLTYSDRYLIDTIVPKMETLIRYLKSFGVTLDEIDVEEAKQFLDDFKSYTKEELEDFLEQFIDIYRYYEEIKKEHGIDYPDMLIKFLDLTDTLNYRHVLVDELQDVNEMEADVALASAERFFAVGDQKQAIFGFQGGSILNFEKFKDSDKFVLSENFRSVNAVLDYARSYFSSNTSKDHHVEDLKDLENKTRGYGDKPVVFDVDRDDKVRAVCTLVCKIADDEGQVGIITRTNRQIMKISEELKNRDIDHSSTFFSSSSDAQTQIVKFLRGVLSNDVYDVKEALFTPFFPVCLQEAFELAEQKKITLQEIYNRCPQVKRIREDIANVEDVSRLFQDKIIPVSVTYGEEYLLASLKLMDAFREAMRVIDDKNIDNLCVFLESCDLLTTGSGVEKNVMLTTVHKAKGKQFDKVIYVPSRMNNRANFQDAVVTAILKSNGVDPEEELEEESLRVDFVAMSRAKNNLFVVTDKPNDYLNDYASLETIEALNEGESVSSELKTRAYTLFLNGEYEEAKKLMEKKEPWLRGFIENYFESLDSVSFSRVKKDPYKYLKDNILDVSGFSPAMSLGSGVHNLAEKVLKDEDYELTDELKPYKENIEKLVEEVKDVHGYPLVEQVEESFKVPLSKLAGVDEELDFAGKIDVVFKNRDGKYLIVDWKTSKRKNRSSDHRRQLLVYKKAFSLKYDVPVEDIRVAIGYVGLKKRINDGNIRAELDDRQPQSASFDTFKKHLSKVLSWKDDVDLFFEELSDVKDDDPLLRNVIEQYNKEI